MRMLTIFTRELEELEADEKELKRIEKEERLKK